MIDIDLKSNELKDRLYNDSHILNIIDNYNKALNGCLNLGGLKFYCYLFEQPKRTQLDNINKDGFHLMVPEICTTIEIRHAVRNRAVELCNESKVFNHYLETDDKLIDKSVVSSNGWFLYGSYKPGGAPYTLTKVYNKKAKGN